MGATSKPRKLMSARAGQRLSPIERALLRRDWRRAEQSLLEMPDGADMGALLRGFWVNLADAHTIAETREDQEPARVLDDAMGMVNRMCENGMRMEASCGEFLAWAGSLAIEILLGSPMRDIHAAMVHRAKVLAAVA